MSDPDTIRAEIEATRRNLSTDVDALADKVSPSQIVDRQKERVKGRLRGVQESIMGTVHDAQDAVGAAKDHVVGSAGSAGGSVSDVASNATQTAKQTATGHPIIVGAIAFGVGWLVSSLLPSSDAEQRLAVAAKEKAEPLTDKVKEVAKDAGQEMAQNLKQPAQEAAQTVKESATDAAQTVKGEAQSAAQDVKGQAQDAKQNIQGSAQDAKDELQGQAQDAKQNLQS